MKKRFFYFVLLVFTNVNALSQVGINTTSPEPGSALDIFSTNKGLLIPRVQLLDINDTTTIPVVGNDEGTVVFNLEDAGQSPQNIYKNTFYIWNGTVWEDLSPLIFARDVIYENNISSTIFVARPSTDVIGNASTAYTPWTSINFANESLDSENIHNNGIFIISETGLYSFSGGISITRSNNSGARKYFGGRITLNGKEVASSMFGTSGGGGGGFIPLFWNAWLTAGDEVQIQYRMRDSNASGTFTLENISNINIIKNSN